MKFEDTLASVRKECDQYAKHHLDRLQSVPREATLKELGQHIAKSWAEGSRWHSAGAVLVAQALNRSTHRVLPFGFALDLAHCAFHSAHLAPQSSITSQALCTESFRILVTGYGQKEPSLALHLINDLAEALGPEGCAGGLFMKNTIAADDLTLARVEAIQQREFTQLMKMAITGAAQICESNEEESEALQVYGFALGFLVNPLKNAKQQWLDRTRRAMEPFGVRGENLKAFADYVADHSAPCI